MGKERVERESKKSKGIGLRLSPFEKDEVNYICAKNQMEISDMIRKLISQEYNRLKSEE